MVDELAVNTFTCSLSLYRNTKIQNFPKFGKSNKHTAWFLEYKATTKWH